MHAGCVYVAAQAILTYSVRKGEGKGISKKSGNISHYG